MPIDRDDEYDIGAGKQRLGDLTCNQLVEVIDLLATWYSEISGQYVAAFRDLGHVIRDLGGSEMTWDEWTKANPPRVW